MMQEENATGASGGAGGGGARSSHNAVRMFFVRASQTHQALLDRCTPHVKARWAFAVGLIVVFLLRVLLSHGWYIITYGLGIYHLNLFIAFLTPKMDPAMDLDTDYGPELPTFASEEFRPFVRRLPEFKFWHSVMNSTMIAIFMTCFDALDIPVFWPILVLYFVTLFCVTMKRQIRHMIKYKYLPFTHNKPRYQAVPTNSK